VAAVSAKGRTRPVASRLQSRLSVSCGGSRVGCKEGARDTRALTEGLRRGKAN
jgi:hypothetical protein